MPSPRGPQQLIKPPALRAGAKIGIIAPASPIDRDAFESGCNRLRQMSYEPVYSNTIFDRDLFFAGSAERRVRELQEMFTREDVGAILCSRGGYGCNYLLPLLDPETIKKHPKIFIGYSDVTTLLTWLHDRVGLAAFHGPMLVKDFAHEKGVDRAAWKAALEGESSWSVDTTNAEPLMKGNAEGILYGGCISLLVASLATPYEIKTEGAILFLEDFNAKPYQIDRMLMQLKLAGKFKGVCAIFFGQMLDCIQPGGQSYSLQEVIKRALGDIGIPIAYGLRSGHVSSRNITLPIGVRAQLKVDDSVSLKILESATAASGGDATASRSSR